MLSEPGIPFIDRVAVSGGRIIPVALIDKKSWGGGRLIDTGFIQLSVIHGLFKLRKEI